MGLDMYLNRVPKVNTLEDLKVLNDRLDNAFVNGNIIDELRNVKKEMDYIYDIDMSINCYVDIDKWKQDKNDWGNIIDLGTRVGYWRKFNALHKWMVENVQNGVDDCGEYIVTVDHFNKLKNVLDTINENNASEILPPAAGFFFGGTEYDKWYYDDVVETIKIIEEVVADETGEYYYQASW